VTHSVPDSETYYLEPGYVFVNGNGMVIRTVVGSCIVVALWDCKKKVGGMNHYIHPKTNDPQQRTTVYGNIALPVLLSLMQREFCCNVNDLQAQVFGGATPSEFSSTTEGKKNISIAMKYLSKNRIHIISKDVGGFVGRKILFDTATGHTAVLKVQRIRRDDWYDKSMGKGK
jgi:chemotaxis protein CheD